jgi:heme exporter protein A
MIRVQGLVKSFGHTYALRGIDLEVAEGEFLTILGPNGAGKTTLLRILATLLKPTSGLVHLNGFEVASGDAAIRRQIGFVSHQPLLYDNLTVEENLRFYGRIYDVDPLDNRVDTLLDLVGLDSRRHSLAATLSRGMRQRLSVARSVIHEPAIMLLDEPYTGLDQQAARMLPDLLRSVSPQARTVVMTTHNLEQGLELCDRLVILSRGRVAYQEKRAALTVSQLREAYWDHTQGHSGHGVG